MAVLETQDLTYTYAAGSPFEMPALRGVPFSTRPGDLLGIIGHTGSGKSTLSRRYGVPISGASAV